MSGGLGFFKSQWTPGSSPIRSGQKNVLPVCVKVAIVPSAVFIHHCRRRRMAGNVLYETFTQHPDIAPILEALAIISAGSHFFSLP
jgi:hypothetical protein